MKTWTVTYTINNELHVKVVIASSKYAAKKKVRQRLLIKNYNPLPIMFAVEIDNFELDSASKES